MIAVYKEAGNIFIEKESILLKITEEVTLINEDDLSDSIYEKAVGIFGEKTADILMAIGTMNFYNRLVISLNLVPK